MDYNNLDMGVVNLAKAIKQKESGGGRNTVSKLSREEGSFGSFQYLEPTFKQQAKLLGGKDLNGNPLDIHNDEHQNLVFYTWAKNLKDQGYGVDQIAAAHNGGEKRLNVDNYMQAKGVNKFGNKYDVPAYVDDVVNMYQQFKSQSQPYEQQVSIDEPPAEPAEPTIDELRAERMAQGLPIAVNPNKVAPNFFSNLVRGTVKPFASVGVGAKKAAYSLGGAIAGNDEALLKNDPTKAVKSKFLGDIYPLAYDKEGLNVKKGVGQLAEIASVGVGGGTVGGLGQVAKTGFKEGAKQALRASVPLIKEGAISGALGGFGTSLQNDENLGGVIRDTAIGAGIGAVATPVLSGATAVLGKGVGKVFSKTSNFLATPAETLQKKAVEQGIEQLSKKVGSVDNAFRNATYDFVDNAGVRTTITPVDTFTKYKLNPEVVDGSINVQKIYDAIDQNMSSIDNKIDETLINTGKKVSIDDLKLSLEDGIRNNDMLKRGGKVNEVLKAIQSRIDDWKESYGDEIDVLEINEIRKTANSNFKKERFDIDRAIGDTARDVVYNATDDRIVRELLNEERALINAEKFADRIKGKAVQGGRLGNYVFSGLGAMVGKASGGDGPVSAIIGAFGGRKLSEFLQSRAFRSLPADIKASIEKNYLKSPQMKDTTMTASMISNIAKIISDNTKKVNVSGPIASNEIRKRNEKKALPLKNK